MKNQQPGLKNWIRIIHLWLGLSSGLFVCFLGITGCILAFEREIENLTQSYRFTKVQNAPLIAPSELKKIADKALPGKLAHSVGYEPGNSAEVVYFNENPEYYYIVYLNPYTGKVIKVKDMNSDFFRIILMGHYYLWLPPTIGQPILATATLLFTFLLITGLFLWWPKNKAASQKRFTIKWNARWKRVNYDLHNVLGFYITWVIIFIAISGLVMGFQWFSKSVYWVSSGGKQLNFCAESYSDTSQATKPVNQKPPMDVLWLKFMRDNPTFDGGVEVHVPVNDKSAIEMAINPDTDTYWKTDYRYFDQYNFTEIPVKHVFGRFQKATVADKILRMNYDIHVGAICGIATKIIAFFASLIAASLPVTGFLICFGRRKKTKERVSVEDLCTVDTLQVY